MGEPLSLPVLVGQLLVGGFVPDTLPSRRRDLLARGLRGGAILFRRNLPSIETGHALCREIVAAAASSPAPPFIGIDEEGGRVTRMPRPFLALPPMRRLGATADAALVERVAGVAGDELGAVGFNVDFAPVVDVDTNPNNPIIGDRSFSGDTATVSRLATAFIRGLQQAGVMACAKHFPGHGDTSLDSHLDLPVVQHSRERLEAVEIPPFAAAIDAGVATMMTAHVVFEALDPSAPATLSHAIMTELLRKRLAFDGVLFSDALEMKAISARMAIEDGAVAAVAAGCDVLLVCSDEDGEERAYAALLREAEKSPAFQARCLQAATRAIAARKRFPPRPAGSKEELASRIDTPGAREVAEALVKLDGAHRS